MITQTDAIATVMAQQAEVERRTMTVVENVKVRRTANRSLGSDMYFVDQQKREAREEWRTVEMENVRLKTACPDWEARLIPAGATQLVSLEDLRYTLARREVQLLQDLRANRPQWAMAASDAASLARVGGLSHAYHAVAHEGPLADALSQLAASSRLLVEANEALEEETKKSMFLDRQVACGRHEVVTTQYEIRSMTDENEQIERMCEELEINHLDWGYVW